MHQLITVVECTMRFPYAFIWSCRTLEDYKHEFNMYIIEEFFEIIYNGSYKSAIRKQPREN